MKKSQMSNEHEPASKIRRGEQPHRSEQEWECPDCHTRYVKDVGRCGDLSGCSRPNVVPSSAVATSEPQGFFAGEVSITPESEIKRVKGEIYEWEALHRNGETWMNFVDSDGLWQQLVDVIVDDADKRIFDTLKVLEQAHNAAIAAELEQSVDILREKSLEFAEQSGSQIKTIRQSN